MSTCSLSLARAASPTKIAAESAIAGVIASGVALLVNSNDPWMASTALHPVWVAVLALSAFYGLRGMVIAAPIAWSILGLSGLLTGAGVQGLMDRAISGQDLWMAVTCLIVAGVAMVHDHRRGRLEETVTTLATSARTDSELLEKMREQVVALKSRAERVDVAIPVWRDVASRISTGDAKVAASAVLDMCLLRTGARAGIVRSVEGTAMHNIAWRGRWSRDRQVPRDIFPDRTIATALERCKGVLASDVAEATADDSDLAVPLRSPVDGTVLGILALRGARKSELGIAQLLDVSSMARWLADSLASDTSRTAAPASESTEDAAAGPARQSHLFVVEDRP